MEDQEKHRQDPSDPNRIDTQMETSGQPQPEQAEGMIREENIQSTEKVVKKDDA